MIRLSGPEVSHIARRLLEPYPVQARRATLCIARDRQSVILDRLIAIRYERGGSYTGEEMLELICHGGDATSAAVLRVCMALGARGAERGEFTRRALLSGCVDLAQAEALPDLIEASSESMRRAALGIVGGALSRSVAALREKVLGLEAMIAYHIDFPEEDDGPIADAQVLRHLDDVRVLLMRMLDTARGGSVLRDGALVVLAGPPNVGKSSLFNSLLGQDRAIVTPLPGTTRDAVEHMSLAGSWPIRLVDTAGLRPSSDLIEQLGIEVSERYIKDADLIVLCSDGSAPLNDLKNRMERQDLPTIGVHTKCDLRLDEVLTDGIAVSAVTGAGLAVLRAAIAHALDQRFGSLDLESPVITQARHRDALSRARDELDTFEAAWRASVTPTVAAIHIRAAVTTLDEIIGAVSVDDLLDVVFARFCVGK